MTFEFEPRRPAAAPAPLPAESLLSLQRTAGNRAVARWLGQPSARGPYHFPEGDRPAPWPQAPDVHEWFELQPIQHFFEPATITTYDQVREPFLRRFGHPEVGVDVAIGRALAYYTTLVPVSFLGNEAIWVHPEMAAALARAAEQIGRDIPFRAMMGANIRFVRGRPGVMSDHSWGASVDIDGGTNPMTSGLAPRSERVELIDALSGVDVTRDAAGRPMTSRPRTSAQMQQEAERLQAASDDLEAAFTSEQSLAAAALKLATERGAPTGGAGALFDVMMNLQEGNADRADLMAFVFPAAVGQWDPRTVTETLDALTTMGRIWTEILARGGPERIGMEPQFPSDAALAVHGFMNLPPEVVAALSGSDAGNLKWLGSESGSTKDFMHFDLRQRPQLY
jgi:hypothetical protein